MTTKTKTKGTPTTQREQFILSGLFALTNMGQPVPKNVAEIFQRLHNTTTLTISNCMMAFCQDYMENDDHQDMFQKEAEWWYKDTFSKKQYTREKIISTWKQHDEIVLLFNMTDRQK